MLGGFARSVATSGGGVAFAAKNFSTVRRDAKFCPNACRQANYRWFQYNGESNGR
jgi:hypothetical protein